MAITSLTWGSSYLWIALGLESFAPGLVAWLRLILGAAALLAIGRLRGRVPRHDWPGIAIVGVVGNAAPALLFALAEQTVESSVVGMLTAATPLATLAVAFAMGNRTLRSTHVVGLLLGLVGVVLMTIGSVTGTSRSVAGVVYVLIAILGYAVTSNVIGPLAERYGAVAVLVRAQLLAAAVMTPLGISGIGKSTFSWKSFIAVAILGILGTGMARSVQATLIARSGAPRASIVGYLVPVVAAILGVVVLSETLDLAEIGGLLIVTLGAYLGSRRIARPARE